ncbi:MAG: hypothetical protein JO036_04260 [Candidatus Eremiobacteraeota bacterium]|nr:hypothetical protein [Candidatus Eremiobacteraeota bacterium]
MMRVNVRGLVGLTLLGLGAGFALASPAGTWIEARFGVDPDGGSGLAEFWATAIPIAAGLGIAATFLLRRFASRRGRRAVP